MVFHFVLKEKVRDHDGNIGKPQKVRNDKHFAERNVVVKPHVDNGILFGYRFLQMAEPCHVDDSVNNQRNRMTVIGIQFF